MFNRIIMIGNLTREPELRYSKEGTTIVNFGLAVNKKFKQGEEMKEEVTFINIVVFGKQADTCGQYLNKGSQVLVEGSLRESRWETPEGQKRSKHEIVAQNVRFMSKRNEDNSSSGYSPAGGQAPEETTDIEPF